MKHVAPNPKAPLHFLGIGGSGMCPLACLARANGWPVSGSDQKENANTLLLQGQAIPIAFGHRSFELVGQAQTVVISSAIKADNPELLFAQKQGLRVIHRSDLLAFFLESKKGITVAGTHGKTTTSALTAYLLTGLGADPDAVIGGHLPNFDASWRKGQGPYLVAEADESDGTFLKYRPFIGLLTNIDQDHLDYYQSQERIEAAFAQYLEHIRPGGYAIVGTDQAACARLFQNFKGPKLSFGLQPTCDLYADNIKPAQDGAHFRLNAGEESFECHLNALGNHNILNALAALGVVKALGLPLAKAVSLLPYFQGVGRRLAVLHNEEMLSIIDDYAHNPGKIAACLAAVKAAFSEHKLWVVWQPHRFSRLETMYSAFMAAFSHADHTYVTPVFAAGEAPKEAYTPQRLAQDISHSSHTPASPCPSLEELLKKMLEAKTQRQKLVILTIGAGDIYQFSEALRQRSCLASSQQDRATAFACRPAPAKAQIS